MQVNYESTVMIKSRRLSEISPSFSPERKCTLSSSTTGRANHRVARREWLLSESVQCHCPRCTERIAIAQRGTAHVTQIDRCPRVYWKHPRSRYLRLLVKHPVLLSGRFLLCFSSTNVHRLDCHSQSMLFFSSRKVKANRSRGE